MIRVYPADEPTDFDAKVRQRGLRAIAEMTGQSATKRRGPKRKVLASRPEDIPADRFPPYWTNALDQLLLAYRRICAFACVYIEPGAGTPSVDHMVPKSRAWDQVYQWLNYRLACQLINTYKGELPNLIDPFEVNDD